MSSCKTRDRGTAELSEDLPREDSWVLIESPRAVRAMPTAGRVVAALANLRDAYSNGDAEDELDLSDISVDYGSGDPGLSQEIERATRKHWDS